MYKKDFPERRKHIRVDVAAGINVEVENYSASGVETERIEAVTKNLSLEGACFLSCRKFCPGESVRMELVTSPDADPIRMIGQVIWIGLYEDNPVERYETSVNLSLKEKTDEERLVEYISGVMKTHFG